MKHGRHSCLRQLFLLQWSVWLDNAVMIKFMRLMGESPRRDFPGNHSKEDYHGIEITQAVRAQLLPSTETHADLNVKCVLLLPDINQNWSVSTNFSNPPTLILISTKSVQWTCHRQAGLNGQTYGRILATFHFDRAWKWHKWSNFKMISLHCTLLFQIYYGE